MTSLQGKAGSLANTATLTHKIPFFINITLENE